jgi:hypothetical protein
MEERGKRRARADESNLLWKMRRYRRGLLRGWRSWWKRWHVSMRGRSKRGGEDGGSSSREKMIKSSIASWKKGREWNIARRRRGRARGGEGARI